MGNAYKYSDFVSNNGHVEGLTPYNHAYNEVMKSPAREVQFLVIKANSDYVPPDYNEYISITITTTVDIDASVTASVYISKETYINNGTKAIVFQVPKSFTSSFDITISCTNASKGIDNDISYNGIICSASSLSSTQTFLTVLEILSATPTITINTVNRQTPNYSLNIVYNKEQLNVTMSPKPSSVTIQNTNIGKSYNIPPDVFLNGGQLELQISVTSSGYEPYIESMSGQMTYTQRADGAYIFLTITAMSGDVTLNIDRRSQSVDPPEPDEKTWNNISVSHGYGWESVMDDENILQYTGKVIARNKVYALEFPFIDGADYRFQFLDMNSWNAPPIYPTGVYVAAKDTPIGENEKDNGSSGYTYYSLEADTTNECVVWGFPAGAQLRGRYLRMCFYNFVQPDPAENGAKPLLAAAQAYYAANSVSPDSSYDSLTGIYFDGEDIVSVNITTETDVLAKDLPYSEYTLVVNDPADRFNPLMRDNLQSDFDRYQDFDFYSMSRNADVVPEEWYITKIGRAKLDNIESSNMTATLSFIGLVEYYDHIYLNDEELLYSDHFKQIPVGLYLYYLFGSDIAQKTIDEFADDYITTPFYSESKSEILRTIAEYFCGYVHENEEGKLEIKKLNSEKIYTDQTGNTVHPFKLSLDYQTINPDYKQDHTVPDRYLVTLHQSLIDATSYYIWDSESSPVICEWYTKTNDIGAEYVLRGSYDRKGRDASGLLPVGNPWLRDLVADSKAKYVKLRLKFPSPFALSSFITKNTFDSSYSNYFGLNYTDYIGAETIMKYANFMYTNANGVSYGGLAICENYIEIWRENAEPTDAGKQAARIRDIDDCNAFIPVNEVPFYDNNGWGNYLIVLDILAYVIALLVRAKVKNINETTTVYKVGNTNERTQNEVELQNILVSDFGKLKNYFRYYRSNYENYRYEFNVNQWLGNAAIKISDKILCGFARNSGVKTFENYYTGIIRKKQIDYDGGYSEDVTLSSYPQKFYQQEVYHSSNYTYEEINNPVVNDTYTHPQIALKLGNGFKFSMVTPDPVTGERNIHL